LNFANIRGIFANFCKTFLKFFAKSREIFVFFLDFRENYRFRDTSKHHFLDNPKNDQQFQLCEVGIFSNH